MMAATPSAPVSISVDDLEKRLDELKDQGQRRHLEERGESVAEIANTLLPFSFIETRNLLAIEKDPLLKKALANWEEKQRFFDSRVQRKKCNIESIKNEIFQVVAFYFIFQGLLLTCVTQRGGGTGFRLSRESRLYLVLVSLAASLLSLLVITRKFLVIRDLAKTVWVEQQGLKEVLRKRAELLRNGDKFKFYDTHYKAKPRHYSFFGTFWADYAAAFILYQTAWVFPLAVWRISS